MSTKDYSSAERGGGSGDTGRMRAAILNQINSWWDQAKWEDPDKADRVHEKLNEAPERFISPNPSTNYREEASRVYKKLKRDYSLRSVTDLEDIAGEYEKRAKSHVERKKRKEGFDPEPSNELAGAPEPERVGPEPDKEGITPPTETADIEISAEPGRPDLPDPSDRPDLVTSADPDPDPGPDPDPAETADPGRPDLPDPADRPDLVSSAEPETADFETGSMSFWEKLGARTAGVDVDAIELAIDGIMWIGRTVDPNPTDQTKPQQEKITSYT